MNWRVTLDFKRGPSFTYEVRAKDEFTAITIAKSEAAGYGFDAPVKKAAAIPMRPGH